MGSKPPSTTPNSPTMLAMKHMERGENIWQILKPRTLAVSKPAPKQPTIAPAPAAPECPSAMTICGDTTSRMPPQPCITAFGKSKAAQTFRATFWSEGMLLVLLALASEDERLPVKSIAAIITPTMTKATSSACPWVHNRSQIFSSSDCARSSMIVVAAKHAEGTARNGTDTNGLSVLASDLRRSWRTSWRNGHLSWILNAPFPGPFPLFGCSCTLMCSTHCSRLWPWLLECWFTLHFQLAHHLSSSSSASPVSIKRNSIRKWQSKSWIGETQHMQSKNSNHLHLQSEFHWTGIHQPSPTEQAFWLEEHRSKKLLKNLHAPNIYISMYKFTILHQC